MESPWVKAGLRLLVTLEMGELLVNCITWWYSINLKVRQGRCVYLCDTENRLEPICQFIV